jgi:uncharacterized membrane protein
MEDIRQDTRRVHRRRRRMVYAAAAAVVAVLLTFSAVAYAWDSLREPQAPTGNTPVTQGAQLPQSCEVQRLPLPGGAVSSFVSGGDRTGRYLVGRSTDAAGVDTVLVWRDGALVTQTTMPGAHGSLDDINSSGVAIGNSVDEAGVNHAYLFRDGQFTELTAADGATARAIGEQGIVVGGRGAPNLHQPVVWPAGQTAATDLKIDMGNGDAVDVDADGTIVGLLYYPIEPHFGLAWKADGAPTRLPTVPNGVNQGKLLPGSITNGVIAGRLSSFDGAPATLDVASGATTVITQQVGVGVPNSRGWFAGRIGDGLALVSPDARVALAVPAPGAVAREETLVRTLSEDGGVIGGQIADANGVTQAVRWTCR